MYSGVYADDDTVEYILILKIKYALFFNKNLSRLYSLFLGTLFWCYVIGRYVILRYLSFRVRVPGPTAELTIKLGPHHRR